MKRIVCVLGLVALAGCGADGEPVQPDADLAIGISTNGGIHAGASVGVTRGPLRVGVSVF